MPTKDQIEKVNASLRSRLVKSIELAKVVHTEEGIALMQRDLDGYAHAFGTFIAGGATFDQDVLVGFAELRRLVADLNEDNREDNGGEDILTVRRPYFEHPFTHVVMTFDIPEPAAVIVKHSGAGRTSDSTSAGSGGDSDDHVNGTAYAGAGGHYQALDGGDDHTLHLKVAGASSGGCCEIM